MSTQSTELGALHQLDHRWYRWGFKTPLEHRHAADCASRPGEHIEPRTPTARKLEHANTLSPAAGPPARPRPAPPQRGGTRPASSGWPSEGSPACQPSRHMRSRHQDVQSPGQSRHRFRHDQHLPHRHWAMHARDWHVAAAVEEEHRLGRLPVDAVDAHRKLTCMTPCPPA